MLWEYLYYVILQSSSLSDSECILIIGHYNKLVTKEKVDPNIYNRGYTPEQIKLMETTVKSKGLSEIKSCGVSFLCSLREFDYPYFDYCYNLYRQYVENGVMPFDGCHSDQPSKIIDIFNLLDQLKYELENNKDTPRGKK